MKSQNSLANDKKDTFRKTSKSLPRAFPDSLHLYRSIFFNTTHVNERKEEVVETRFTKSLATISGC
jgi:hypothetical protein